MDASCFSAVIPWRKWRIVAKRWCGKMMKTDVRPGLALVRVPAFPPLSFCPPSFCQSSGDYFQRQKTFPLFAPLPPVPISSWVAPKGPRIEAGQRLLFACERLHYFAIHRFATVLFQGPELGRMMLGRIINAATVAML